MEFPPLCPSLILLLVSLNWSYKLDSSFFDWGALSWIGKEGFILDLEARVRDKQDKLEEMGTVSRCKVIVSLRYHNDMDEVSIVSKNFKFNFYWYQEVFVLVEEKLNLDFSVNPWWIRLLTNKNWYIPYRISDF